MVAEVDNRLHRLWYVEGNSQTWSDWSQASSSPYIVLVNRPLAFGHSQLVVPAPQKGGVDESFLFGTASKIIVRGLMVFVDVFGSKKIHAKPRYQKLAEVTYSYGRFIKTLVLRTSASECPDRELKIHLVPYFESNQAECHKRFHSLHTASPHAKGGLIGWLGERETQVDKWPVEGLDGLASLDEIGSDVWKIPELAKELKRAMFAKKVSKTR
jgi:hypothetical protein